MTIALRVCLILVSIITMLYMMRKIKQSKLQIEYSVFWIIFSLVLIIISIFPQILIGLASLLGVASPANLVFVIFIFVLLLKIFMMTIELSQLENRVKELIQQIAISEKEKEHEQEHKKNLR